MADKKTEKNPETTEYIVETPAAKAKFDFTSLNTLAVVSIATAATGFGGIAGVITGHVSLAQIKKSGERGRGLAIAGLVIGYGYVALAVLMAVGGAFMRVRGFEIGNHDNHFNNQGGWAMPGHQGGFGDDDGGRGQMLPGQPGQMPDQLPGQPSIVPVPQQTN
jgi:hypothetical protein